MRPRPVESAQEWIAKDAPSHFVVCFRAAFRSPHLLQEIRCDTHYSLCLVLYCIVLYCIVSYWIVLYCIVLYDIVLYCIVSCCVVLHCTVLYCTVLY